MQIWDLFAGFDKAHGSYDVKRTNDRGKAEGKALTLPGAPTPELWVDHITGRGPGLGVIPLLLDNTLWWACLDVDVYNIDHKQLIARIDELGLPLVVCRTKSGGAHCFLFFQQPEPAAAVRPILEEWAALLGHGGCEIFPKQVERFDDKDIGNWLNMPYYYAEKTSRYGIKDGGVALGLDDFLQYADSKRTTLEALQQLGHEQPVGDFEEGPPCLQYLQSKGGFVEGTKKDGMFNVAIYLRKRYPDEWQDKLLQYNLIMCKPPLKIQEVTSLAKQVDKKNYSYRCKLAPINAVCRRTICLGRTYGVGENPEGEGGPEIGNITKYEGDTPLWYVDISGRRVMLTTEELTNQNEFRKKVFNVTNRWLGLVPRARWDRWLNTKASSCDIIETPKEATPFGQFQIIVYQYLTGMAHATTKEELAHRMTPYRTGMGEVWFRSRGILDYLITHSVHFKSEHHVWQMLREMGARHDFINVGGERFNIWILADPGKGPPQPPIPEFGTKEF